MRHASDEELSRDLAAVRPRVPAGFADAVLRGAAVGTTALPLPVPLRVGRARPIALATLASIAAAAAVIAVTRRAPAPVTERVARTPTAPTVPVAPSEASEPAAGPSCPMSLAGAAPRTECSDGEAVASESCDCPPSASSPEDDRRIVLPIDDRAPSLGPPSARVTVIEVIDFECAYCERALATVHGLAAMYPEDVRIVEKVFPLGGHRHAQLAAEAALAAGEQGQYAAMRDLLLANQADLERPALESYAQHLGLDLDRFRRALDDGRYTAQVRQDAEEATRAGITGVPAFIINGRLILGARTAEELKPIVDEELAR